VPDSGTVWVPDRALSVTFNVAEYETLATGLNVTLIVQLLPAVSELPQVEVGVSVNSAAPVPVTVMPIIDSVVAPGIFERYGFGHAGARRLGPKTEAAGAEAGHRIDHRGGQRDRLRIAWRSVHNAQGRGLRRVERTRDKGNRNRAVTPARQRLRALIDFHEFVRNFLPSRSK
jgi:hypothetical protein